jgi:hypothetical protein
MHKNAHELGFFLLQALEAGQLIVQVGVIEGVGYETGDTLERKEISFRKRTLGAIHDLDHPRELALEDRGGTHHVPGAELVNLVPGTIESKSGVYEGEIAIGVGNNERAPG